jgi:hypothetical protein
MMNLNHEIIKLLLVFLGKCHSHAVASAKVASQSLTQETIVDARYGIGKRNLFKLILTWYNCY